MSQLVVCVDLDSTLCDTRQRQHLILEGAERHTTDWVVYAMACADDIPVQGVVALLAMLQSRYHIHILSARSESARQLTAVWLDRHDVYYDTMTLRPDSLMHMHNEAWKAEEVAKLQAEGFEVALMIDDWPPVRDEMAKLSVPTLIVWPPYTDLVPHANEVSQASRSTH